MAEALHGFLRRVIQSARPFHSDKDIAAGDFGDPEIRAALKTVVFAIVCCTPENVTAPWLNYEAGAIAERLEGCTAPLILGSKPEALDRSPIFRLQAREADRAGTLFVVQSLNAKLPQPLADDILAEAFDTHWTKLDETWKAIPAAVTKTPARTDREMLEEVVGLCREIARETQASRSEALHDAAYHDAYTLGLGPQGPQGLWEPRNLRVPAPWNSVRDAARSYAVRFAKESFRRKISPDELEEVLLQVRARIKGEVIDQTDLAAAVTQALMELFARQDQRKRAKPE
jgi:hypothetical protein